MAHREHLYNPRQGVHAQHVAQLGGTVTEHRDELVNTLPQQAEHQRLGQREVRPVRQRAGYQGGLNPTASSDSLRARSSRCVLGFERS